MQRGKFLYSYRKRCRIISYIVYYFDQEKEELEILKQYKGKNKNEINEERKNCYICSNDIKKYKKVDKYIMALSKLYEKEGKA